MQFKEKRFFFWPCCAACGNLVPQPGIKPISPAVEAQSLNQQTARQVPGKHFSIKALGQQVLHNKEKIEIESLSHP